MALLLDRVQGEHAQAGVAREIGRLGESGLREILELLTRSGPSALEPGRRATLEQAIALSSRTLVRDFLKRASAQTGPPERDAALLWMYGVLDDPAGLAPMARLANRAPLELGLLFRESVARTLAKDPAASSAVAEVGRVAADPLLPFLAAAVGDAGAREGLGGLISLLNRSDESDVVVLQQIARIASAIPAPFDDDVSASLRPLLRAATDARLEACVVALGALEDVESAELLTAYLECPDPGLSSAALEALRKIGRQPFPASRALWEVWLQDEERWWAEQAPELLANLAEGEPADVVQRLRLLCAHALHRHAAAVEVCALLEHEDPQVRRLACITLGHLGSPLAIEALRSATRIEETAGEARGALALLGDKGPGPE